MKLIMTLLARNEEDIIRQNIEFHLRHGVDFVIATDNASDDGTRGILLEYEKKGVLRLIDESGRDKSQAEWNNRMMRMAIDEYGADAVFHCDADEFWYPFLGDLKTEIINVPDDVLSVNLTNIVLGNKNEAGSFLEYPQYAVIKPLDAQDYERETRDTNLYFYRYPKKVMFKTKKGYLEVGQGNHNITNNGSDISLGNSTNVCIFHFPLRGKERFYRKVVETGMAVEKNSRLVKGQSFHIRRWFDAYKNGHLDEEYEILTVDENQVERLKASGMLVNFNFLQFVDDRISRKIHFQIQRNIIDSVFNEMKDQEVQRKSKEIQQKNHEIELKNQELQQKKQELEQKDQELQQKDAEIDFMKSSKFWKLRTFNEGVKFIAMNPSKAILKHEEKIRFAACHPVRLIEKYLLKK